MKKIIYMCLMGSMLLLIGSALSAQKTGEQILKKYYTIKDALVAGNKEAVTIGSSEFIKEINQFNIKSIPDNKQKIVQPFLAKLLNDAGAIAEAGNITMQRELFAAFSNSMISLAKELKLSDSPVYVDYCPMKKNYWLSDEQPIRNPYYGNAMLTCGKTTDTLK